MPILISSCANSRNALIEASKKQGIAAARVNMPELPADCRVHGLKPMLKAGENAVFPLKRAFTVIDRGNARITRCADHYDNVRATLR